MSSLVTRPLPSPVSLQKAVELVISSNKADGYVPNRFIPMVKGKTGRDLLQVCEYLITNAETLEHIDKAFAKYPCLLTIEDFVASFGAAWGFSALAVETASARTGYFDQSVRHRRYE